MKYFSGKSFNFAVHVHQVWFPDTMGPNLTIPDEKSPQFHHLLLEMASSTSSCWWFGSDFGFSSTATWPIKSWFLLSHTWTMIIPPRCTFFLNSRGKIQQKVRFTTYRWFLQASLRINQLRGPCNAAGGSWQGAEKHLRSRTQWLQPRCQEAGKNCPWKLV